MIINRMARDKQERLKAGMDDPDELKAYFISTPHPRYSIVSSRIRKP